MRFLPAVLAAALVAPAAATDATDTDTACVAQAQTWRSIELTCPLSTAARYRFAARFSGSHDDTTLALEPRLDGAPLACEAGSRTDSSGDEGEVVLECRFAVAAAGRALQVRLKWYHASYVGHGLAVVGRAAR